jgi:predicted nucleic acid-binding protein
MKNSTGSELLFVDTWGWLVLANDRDPSFAAVAELRRQCAEAGQLWVTTDYVLDETITRLFAATPFPRAQSFCDAIFHSQKLGLLVLEPITAERFQRAYKMRLRYRDKPRISFTDFTSFAVMRELGIRRVLTADAHFPQAGLGFQCLP